MAGFPSFSPSAYSSKKGSDVRSAKSSYEKLNKHFTKHGFPQPLPDRDVGPITDWRFLAGDANQRNVDVEKADKHIGDNFGRVVYWLICSASRMPVDRAVIAYHDQHRELVRWLAKRVGFRVLSTGDLDMSPKPYVKLDKSLKNIMNSWIIVMSPLVADQPSGPPSPIVARRPSQARQSSYGMYKPPVHPGQGYFPPTPEATSIPPLNTNPTGSPYVNPTPPTSPVSPTMSATGGLPAYSPMSWSTPQQLPGGPPLTKQFTVRRKAPPPPKPIAFARAIHDFQPEAGDNEGLAFRTGEMLEITDKTSRAEDGWWMGRLRGGNGKIGLVPAAYVTVEESGGFARPT